MMLTRIKILLGVAILVTTGPVALAQGFDPNLANRYPAYADPIGSHDTLRYEGSCLVRGQTAGCKRLRLSVTRQILEASRLRARHAHIDGRRGYAFAETAYIPGAGRTEFGPPAVHPA